MTAPRLLVLLLVLFLWTAGALLAQSPVAKTKQPDKESAPPTLVAVSLISDGKTYVSIADKLPPSQFRSKTIMLAPGDYTAKGARRGYKAESVDFVVVPNMNPNTVTVICSAK